MRLRTSPHHHHHIRLRVMDFRMIFRKSEEGNTKYCRVALKSEHIIICDIYFYILHMRLRMMHFCPILCRGGEGNTPCIVEAHLCKRG